MNKTSTDKYSKYSNIYLLRQVIPNINDTFTIHIV